MSIRVLRRNRRTNPTHHLVAKREFILFAISLVVFFGGMTSLAWAVHVHPQPPNNQTNAYNEKPDQQNAPAETYTGDITTQRSTSSSASASVSASASAAASAPSASSSSAAQQSERAESRRNVDAGSAQGQTQQGQSAAPADTVGEASEPSTEDVSYHIVHHTAYQATPVYRTVHHQASRAHEVTIGGTTSIEWTACPVCGGYHENAYNERVVDHTNERYCVACGGRHESAYDEVVYD